VAAPADRVEAHERPAGLGSGVRAEDEDLRAAERMNDDGAHAGDDTATG